MLQQYANYGIGAAYGIIAGIALVSGGPGDASGFVPRRFWPRGDPHPDRQRPRHRARLLLQIQLARIQLRVPEYGWTTQKVFHLLNALVCSLRCGTFLFRVQMEQLHPDVLRLMLFDLPGEWRARRLAAQPGRGSGAGSVCTRGARD